MGVSRVGSLVLRSAVEHVRPLSVLFRDMSTHSKYRPPSGWTLSRPVAREGGPARSGQEPVARRCGASRQPVGVSGVPTEAQPGRSRRLLPAAAFLVAEDRASTSGLSSPGPCAPSALMYGMHRAAPLPSAAPDSAKRLPEHVSYIQEIAPLRAAMPYRSRPLQLGPEDDYQSRLYIWIDGIQT